MTLAEAALPASSSAERETAASGLRGALLLFAATVPLSIAASQMALAIAFVAWFLAGRPVPRSPLYLPAAVYSALTLLSAIASPSPWDSVRDTKEILLFFILLAVPAAAAAHPALPRRLLLVWLAGAGVGALWGVASYLATPGGLLYRSSGPFGHYMTFGGMMMLAAVAAFTLLAARGEHHRWPCSGLLLLLLAAVAVSWARNAWLGLPAGLAVAALRLRPRSLLWLAAIGTAAFLGAPDEMRERLASSFDSGANVDRVEMLRFGKQLIRAHPLLGVGPHRIPDVWRDAHPGERVQPHLHDNFIQIAAERGLPALLAWGWLLFEICRRALAAARSAPDAALPVLGLAATAALLTAGLFEYNFGDSEVKMGFLLLASLSVLPAHPALPNS